MLTVTSAERALIEAGKVPNFRAVITHAGGTSETLDASRFLSGSPVIKLGVSADGVFTVGGAVIGSFNFSLINDDGHFDSVDFTGAQIVPQVSVEDTWHSLGTFHLSSHKSVGSVIMCTAYDSLALLDDTEFSVTWPVTFLAAAQAICTRHGLDLASTSFTGASMEFADPEEAMTDRMALAYMAQCTGNHVRMNAAGQMAIERSTGGSKTVNSVFDANLYTSEIAYTGVMITPYGVTTPSLYGSPGNTLMITDNPLITEENVDSVGAMLWGSGGYITAVNAAEYTAGEADILSDFTIEPGDVLTIKGKSFFVTNLTFKLGVREKVSCDAEDPVVNDLRKSNTEIFAAGIASSKETAISAETAALVANYAANNALAQLSVVEDAAGTLAWIQEHGTYVTTSDTTVQPGTIYFELTGGQYVPIANPDPSANPQSEGWYVLDITDSQSQYIMAHLAVTSAGLWVLPAGSFSSHEIEDSAGNTLIDSQGNMVISWQTDPQNADGYKVLLSNSDMVVYNRYGEAVAVYGGATTIGISTGKNIHIDSDSVDVRDGSSLLATFGTETAIYTTDGTELAHFGYASGNAGEGTTEIKPFYTLGTRAEEIEGEPVNPGIYSVAEGLNVVASGPYSHAEGEETIASGGSSHAEGIQTTASAHISHAEGGLTIASGAYSHAEGVSSYAEGEYGSHAEGFSTVASGDMGAHAEGYYTEASGENSHAEGSETEASGESSHAEGKETKAIGDASHAAGYGTEASEDYSTVIGKYNAPGNNVFEIGNGSSDNARSNALEVDWNGNVIALGNATANGVKLVYESGDEVSFRGTVVSGHLTTNNSQVQFFLPLPKPTAPGLTATISGGWAIRHPDGGYILNYADLTSIGTIGDIEVYETGVYVLLDLTTASSFTNNCPVAVAGSSTAKISFS